MTISSPTRPPFRADHVGSLLRPKPLLDARYATEPDKPTAAEIAARELNIKLSYAERAWDFYTKTGTLTRDLAFTDAGLRKVFDTQVKSGLLPATLAFDMSRYVAGGYLERARASVKLQD